MKEKSRTSPVAPLIALLVFATAHAFAAAPQVRIDSGALQGITRDGVDAFKGIPYAAPPTGANRWRAPQPVAGWKGVRLAVDYGHDCVQLPIPGDAGASGSSRGEDCLVLNVWRPSTARAGAKLPVMVWLHGGGFLNGAASVPFFDGSAFARDGIVLVGPNYRLGRLGFFAHPALTAAPDRPLANYAFMDQRAALEWVQRNIAAFGGDPQQVTIVGESAGGISVVQMLSWPAVRGLFQRAAVLSGGGRTYLGQSRELSRAAGVLPSAEESGVAFATSVGISDRGPGGLAALRALPAERVNGDMSMAALVRRPATYAGGPIVDGDIVTGTPQQRFRAGDLARVPLLVGTTGDDLPVVFPPDRERPLDVFDTDAARARELYDPTGTMPVTKLAATVAVDFTMHEPARYLARTYTKAGQRVWLYRFDYVADSERALKSHASHAGELPFLFDRLEARYGAKVTAQDRAAANAFHRYFVNFVKHGDPNGPGAAAWPQFDANRTDLMMFGPGGDATFGPDPWAGRLALVERVADRRAAESPK